MLAHQLLSPPSTINTVTSQPSSTPVITTVNNARQVITVSCPVTNQLPSITTVRPLAINHTATAHHSTHWLVTAHHFVTFRSSVVALHFPPYTTTPFRPPPLVNCSSPVTSSGLVITNNWSITTVTIQYQLSLTVITAGHQWSSAIKYRHYRHHSSSLNFPFVFRLSSHTSFFNPPVTISHHYHITRHLSFQFLPSSSMVIIVKAAIIRSAVVQFINFAQPSTLIGDQHTTISASIILH